MAKKTTGTVRRTSQHKRATTPSIGKHDASLLKMLHEQAKAIRDSNPAWYRFLDRVRKAKPDQTTPLKADTLESLIDLLSATTKPTTITEHPLLMDEIVCGLEMALSIPGRADTEAWSPFECMEWKAVATRLRDTSKVLIADFAGRIRREVISPLERRIKAAGVQTTNFTFTFSDNYRKVHELKGGKRKTICSLKRAVLLPTFLRILDEARLKSPEGFVNCADALKQAGFISTEIKDAFKENKKLMRILDKKHEAERGEMVLYVRIK